MFFTAKSRNIWGLMRSQYGNVNTGQDAWASKNDARNNSMPGANSEEVSLLSRLFSRFFQCFQDLRNFWSFLVKPF